MNSPKVSVIISTYNRAHLLPRAINSVLNQIYQNFELIIVNDASTDKTEEVVSSFNDKRITYCRNKKNKGVLGARNAGLDLAKGKYIVFLDDDDELLPDALGTVVSQFTKLSPEGVKIIWFDDVDAERKKLSGLGLREEGYISYRDYLCGKIRGDHWIVFDKDVFQSNRFDERLWGNENILWLKLLRKFRVFYFPKILVKAYREHGERMSNFRNKAKHIPRIILSKKVLLEEYGEEMKFICPKTYYGELGLLGFWQILNGKKLEGRKNLFQSLRLHFSLKFFGVFLLSFILTSEQLISCYAKLSDVKKLFASLINKFHYLLKRDIKDIKTETK